MNLGKKRFGERALAKRLGSQKKVFGSLPGLGSPPPDLGEYGVGSPRKVRQIRQDNMNTSYKVATEVCQVWEGLAKAGKARKANRNT
jgi:hypothetical protein